LLVIPRLGVMWAELLEMPFMFVVIVLAARRTVKRMSVPAGAAPRLAMGLTALALLIGAEITLVIALRGMTLSEYIANREPVSGVVYLAMLAVFAAVPAVLRSNRAPSA
jgi:hypothetical protein